MLPDGWYFKCTDEEEVQCFHVAQQFNDAAPMIISRILIIKRNLSWLVYVDNHIIPPSNDVLSAFPPALNTSVFLSLIETLHTSNICLGNHDDKFITIARQKKGKFLSTDGQIIAELENFYCFVANGEMKCSTIRHINCHVLLDKQKVTCPPCTNYRNTLRALVAKSIKVHSSPSPSSYTNTRFLRSPQRRMHLAILRKAIRNKNRQLQRLRIRINALLKSKDSVCVDEHLSSDIATVIRNHTVLEKDDFKRMFWEQQVAS